MTNQYDAIVVGARCAGSPTAMLLARRGYSVLLVDKAKFPSDTMSTHFIHAPGVAALARWGLLDQLEATGCPPVTTYSYDFGPFSIAGSPRPADGEARGFGPRRTVLDALLVDAAAQAGAEVREDFTLEGLVMENGRVVGIRGHARGGATVTERAKVVIGADGKHSSVAKAVDAAKYNELPKRSAAYYAYWSNLPTQEFETHIRDEHSRGWGALPTHDDLTCVVVGWPMAEFAANKSDVEGNYMRAFDLDPEFADRVRGATRESRIVGTGDQPNYFRKPFGPGWALVGDAGYHKDAITAMGINDAFRDAEGLARALDDSFAGRTPHGEAMAEYQRARDEAALPAFEFTCDFARIEPPPPEMGQLLAAVSQSQDAMDGFASVMATTLPAPEFFGPENAGRIMAAAA